MTDADSDRRAHESIAQANAARPNPMSDKEFRERVMALHDAQLRCDKLDAEICWLVVEWRRRNG